MKRLIKQLIKDLLETKGLEIRRKIKAAPSCNTLEAILREPHFPCDSEVRGGLMERRVLGELEWSHQRGLSR